MQNDLEVQNVGLQNRLQSLKDEQNWVKNNNLERPDHGKTHSTTGLKRVSILQIKEKLVSTST